MFSKEGDQFYIQDELSLDEQWKLGYCVKTSAYGKPLNEPYQIICIQQKKRISNRGLSFCIQIVSSKVHSWSKQTSHFFQQSQWCPQQECVRLDLGNYEQFIYMEEGFACF